MVIIDSTVWIDYFNGRRTLQTAQLHQAIGRFELGVCDLIVCEVLQGMRSSREFGLAREAMLAFQVFQVGGLQLAIKSAENYRSLRQRGITVRKTIDCLIATFVIESDFALLHNDRDFDHFEAHLGLNVIH